jgi:hypothetical protein
MENEVDFESLCRHCGLCCHAKIGLLDGTTLIHPKVTCKYQNANGICAKYNERFKINPQCNSIKQIMDLDGILPEGCPFTNLRPGYKVAKVVTEEEFNSITFQDIVKGNDDLVNILVKLLDDIACGTSNFKLIDLNEE